jgi:hypothetical protein
MLGEAAIAACSSARDSPALPWLVSTTARLFRLCTNAVAVQCSSSRNVLSRVPIGRCLSCLALAGQHHSQVVQALWKAAVEQCRAVQCSRRVVELGANWQVPVQTCLGW